MADKEHSGASEGSGALDQFVQDENKSPEDAADNKTLLEALGLNLSSSSDSSSASESTPKKQVGSCGAMAKYVLKSSNKEITIKKEVVNLSDKFNGPKGYEKSEQKMSSANVFYRGAQMNDESGGGPSKSTQAGWGGQGMKRKRIPDKKDTSDSDGSPPDKKFKLGPRFGTGAGGLGDPNDTASSDDSFMEQMRDLDMLHHTITEHMNRDELMNFGDVSLDTFDSDNDLFVKTPEESPVKMKDELSQERRSKENDSSPYMEESMKKVKANEEAEDDEKEEKQKGKGENERKAKENTSQELDQEKETEDKKDDSVIYLRTQRRFKKAKRVIKMEIKPDLLTPPRASQISDADSDVQLASPEESWISPKQELVTPPSDGSGDKMNSTNKDETEKAKKKSETASQGTKQAEEPKDGLPEVAEQRAERMEKAAAEAKHPMAAAPQHLDTPQIQPVPVFPVALLGRGRGVARGQGRGGGGGRGRGRGRPGGRGGLMGGRGRRGMDARRGGAVVCNACGQETPVGNQYQPLHLQAPGSGPQRKVIRKRLTHVKKTRKLNHEIEFERASHETKMQRLNLRNDLKIERIQQRHQVALLAEANGQVDVQAGDEQQDDQLNNSLVSSSGTSDSSDSSYVSSVASTGSGDTLSSSSTDEGDDSGDEGVVLGAEAMEAI